MMLLVNIETMETFTDRIYRLRREISNNDMIMRDWVTCCIVSNVFPEKVQLVWTRPNKLYQLTEYLIVSLENEFHFVRMSRKILVFISRTGVIRNAMFVQCTQTRESFSANFSFEISCVFYACSSNYDETGFNFYGITEPRYLTLLVQFKGNNGNKTFQSVILRWCLENG